MLLSDREILELIQKDKAEGMQRLFDRYYRPLVLFADEFLKNREEAEDVVQDLFVKLWESDYLSALKNVSLSTYLFSAVRNRVISVFRKNNIFRESVKLEQMEIPVEVMMETDEQRIDVVVREVERLPQRTRQVMECVMLNNLKYKETAEELGISVNTVKFLLKEGIRRLRKRIVDLRGDILFFFFRRSRQI